MPPLRGACVALAAAVAAAQPTNNVTVDWATVVRQLATKPTLQVVVNPLITRESPVHDAIFESACGAGCGLP